MRSRLPIAPLVALATAAIAFALPQERRTPPPPSAAQQPLTLRVLSYNIRRGIGADEKLDLERAARLIRELQPDFVALQEVDDRTARSGGVNQAMELGRLTGMHAFFGKAMDYDGGGYGECLLSKRDVRMALTHPLAAAANREPRALVEARVRLGADGPDVVFFGTHLDHESAQERLEQARAINRLLNERDEPFQILAGDFNDVPDSPAIAEIRRRWKDAGPAADQLTWPAIDPKQRIDYVFFRAPRGMRVVEAQVLDEQTVSDHRPVLVTFELETP